MSFSAANTVVCCPAVNITVNMSELEHWNGVYKASSNNFTGNGTGSVHFKLFLGK